jgi:hypothetical protein
LRKRREEKGREGKVGVVMKDIGDGVEKTIS